MSNQFTVGVMVTGAVSGAFRSAMGSSQRTLDKLGSVTQNLTTRQQALTRASERYGQIGGQMASRLVTDLNRVKSTMAQVESQQKRLTSAMAVQQAGRNNRMALYGQGLETYGQARALYGAVSPALQQSMTFKSNMVDMAITAGYDNKTRDQLGAKLRGWSQQYNQLQSDLQTATSSLIGNGIDSLKDIEAYMPDIARGATATNTTAELWAQAAFTTQQSLGVAAKDFRSVQNIMASAGKAGSFEIADQVKKLPELAPMFAPFIQGKAAVAEMGASLQVARIGAGSSDEAANNLKNFVSKIFAPDTQKRFADAGIDIKGSLMQQQAKGISPIEGMMNTVKYYLDQKGPEATAQFKAAMQIKDDKARDAALQSLANNFQLGELFSDMQVMAFVRPMLANMDTYRQIRADALKAANQDVLGADYKSRMEDPLVALRQLSVEGNELALTLGDQLAPSFIALTQEVIPWMRTTSQWAKANPQVIRHVVSLATGLLALKGGLIATKLGINLLLSPFTSLWVGAATARSRWLLLKSAFGQGGTFRRIAGSAWRLSKVLSGGLAKGIMIAGRAILWMGRAMLMNPIGLLITGIAVGAYLIYRYWEPISGWFKARWADIQQAFSGGIGSVAALIINWSPLGLFYKAFAGVMRYFNIELPATFTEFGGNIVDGLINGIKNKWAQAKEVVTGLGGSMKDWFKETLGIHSPSRVFAGFGDNIVQGTVIGIARSQSEAEKATQQLAGRMVPPAPNVPDYPAMALAGQGASAGAGGGGIHIMFSPNIIIDGQRQEPAGALRDALNMGANELEKMIARLLHQQQRRSFS